MAYRNAFSWSHVVAIASVLVVAVVPLSASLFGVEPGRDKQIEARVESFAAQALDELRIAGETPASGERQAFLIDPISFADLPIEAAQGFLETKEIEGITSVVWTKAVVEYRTSDGVEHARMITTILPASRSEG